MKESTRIAIVQQRMYWTTQENTQFIIAALETAAQYDAQLCVFPELAITGFHRRIREEAKPEIVAPSLAQVRAACAKLSMATVIGVPTFRESGAVVNAVEFITRNGETAGHVEKIGITPAEATFLQAGVCRPILNFEGLRSTAIVCREALDREQLCAQLTPGTIDVIFWPGIMRPDPERPDRSEHHIDDAAALAVHTSAYVIQSNWPDSLNYPEESAEQGHSVVISPLGKIMFRLPKAKPGIGVFELGDSTFRWIDL
jgi:predicted amidohydrolase